VRRSDQRRRAVFALYQHDLTGRPLEETLGADAPEFARALAYAVDDHREELDGHIARHAERWTVERIAPLERAILRVAVLELLHADLVAGERPIPPEGAIDEAVEIAKAYCGAEAPAFVNGVLAAVKRSAEAARA
jgi:transcription antitermination protein NusB